MSNQPSSSKQPDGRNGPGAGSAPNTSRISTLPKAEGALDTRPHTLAAFQKQEGPENRKRRRLELWGNLAQRTRAWEQEGGPHVPDSDHHHPPHTLERAQSLKNIYDAELVGRCKTDPSTSKPSRITWEEFQKYADAKEAGGCHPLLSPAWFC
jgi:hypothetical protein